MRPPILSCHRALAPAVCAAWNVLLITPFTVCPSHGTVLREGKGQGCGATQMKLAALWGPNKLPKCWLHIGGRALSFKTQNYFSRGHCREGLAQMNPRCCSCVRVLSEAGPPDVRPLRSFLFRFRAVLDKGTHFLVSPSANGFQCMGLLRRYGNTNKLTQTRFSF